MSKANSSKKFDDFIDLNEENINKIKKAYFDFIKVSEKTSSKSNLTKEEKNRILNDIVQNLIDKAFINKEKDNKIKYPKKIKNEFKKKILDLIKRED